MTDLRRKPRLSPLVIRAEFACDGVARNGYLTNLSEGGAFLATEDDLPAEEPFPLRIVLPWRLGEIGAAARVVWRTNDSGAHRSDLPAGAGVVFTEVKGNGAEKIRIYMQKFHQLVAQIDQEGLEPVLEKLAREAEDDSPTAD